MIGNARPKRRRTGSDLRTDLGAIEGRTYPCQKLMLIQSISLATSLNRSRSP